MSRLDADCRQASFRQPANSHCDSGPASSPIRSNCQVGSLHAGGRSNQDPYRPQMLVINERVPHQSRPEGPCISIGAGCGQRGGLNEFPVSALIPSSPGVNFALIAGTG